MREHVEFGTQVAKQNSHAETDDQLHPLREVPRWTWAGDDAGSAATGMVRVGGTGFELVDMTRRVQGGCTTKSTTASSR